MSDWVTVKCPKCNGAGSCPEETWWMHPQGFAYVECPMCKGKKFLLARPVETKPTE